jgi:alkanesulfonate monooxygenase SsuD/methylene tetrahydromethanopterin reductase-like flavin-dependent oxidoreductase (luciferase family)
LHIGGESEAALRRAARAGDGWVGMAHTMKSVATPVARLRELLESFGRSGARFEVSVGGPVAGRDDVRRWEDADVDRLIVSPWTRSREAVDGLRAFAELVYG